MERFSLREFIAAQTEFESPRWQPSVDIYRTAEDAWLLKFDLAGVEQKDVHLFVQGNKITVSGQRRDWTATQGYRTYHMEIAYNQFERSVDLPSELDATSCSCEFRNGMLLVTVGTKRTRGG